MKLLPFLLFFFHQLHRSSMQLTPLVCCVTVCLILFWQLYQRLPLAIFSNHDWSDSYLMLCQVPFSSWLVWTGRLPETYRNINHPPFDKKEQTGYFLHITDMHIDIDYIQGGTVSSSCHRLAKNSNRAIFNSNKTKKTNKSMAGKYGIPGEECDSPLVLAQHTLDWISKEWKEKLDFVVWTGDSSKHGWDKKLKRKRRDVYEHNRLATDMMLEAFYSEIRDIPIIPNFGNNDVYPHNTIGQDPDSMALFSYYEKIWEHFIPDHQRQNFRQGGYFIVPVANRISVISLNTIHFYQKNSAIQGCFHENSPAASQLQWFEKQLITARQSSEKIYVMGHVPPSPHDYKNSCLEEYMRIATNYTDVVMGHFFAHLNMDHFLMFDSKEANRGKSPLLFSPSLDNSTIDVSSDGANSQQFLGSSEQDEDDQMHVTKDVNAYMDWLRGMYENIDPLDDKRTSSNRQPPLAVVQVAPSVIPVYHPAFRIYKYKVDPNDQDSTRPHGTLLKYTQYFANLTKWNSEELKDEKLEYELEYSTDQAYGMEDLSVGSYYEFAKSLVENTDKGNRLWSLYRQHMLVSTKEFS